MSFLLSSLVRVTNPNLKSYNAVGVVQSSGFTKTVVQLPSGQVIEFLNHNLERHTPPKSKTVVETTTDFRVDDLVQNRGGQEAKVIRVHDQPSVQYLNVELLGEKYPQVQTWRAEGVDLVSRAVSGKCNEITSPVTQQIPKTTEEYGKFILWSPQSNKPPKVIHTTLSQAHEAQKTMAERYPQQEFYIMKAVSKMRMERKVELVPVVEQY